MESRIEKILKKLERDGKVHRLSHEETEEVRTRINEQLREFEREARYLEAKSIEEAKRIYVF